ncbi:MAG: hypothetical protein AAFZ46_11110 [Pseudomonadota bacterium]
MNPKSRFHACTHLLRDLPSVLFAFKCALGRKYGLQELSLRRILKPEVEALSTHTTQSEGIAQIEEGTGITAGAFEVVEDHDKLFAWLRVDEAEQRCHT